MTSVEQLWGRLADQFPDFEQVEESVARFTRKAAEQTFAVCYIDVSEDMLTAVEKCGAWRSIEGRAKSAARRDVFR